MHEGARPVLTPLQPSGSRISSANLSIRAHKRIRARLRVPDLVATASFAAALLISCSAAFAGTFVAFGPQEFVRGRGMPV